MSSHREALDTLARARQTSSLNPPTAQDQPNEVPPPRHRVIVDTDAANEADDQFAIVHALLSPTLDVRGLVPAHFGLRRSTTSLAESRAEIERLLALLGDTTTRVADGAETWIPDEQTPDRLPGCPADHRGGVRRGLAAERARAGAAEHRGVAAAQPALWKTGRRRRAVLARSPRVVVGGRRALRN